MTEPRAIIRAYKPDDEKLVKFTLGLAAMEGLAVANKRGRLELPPKKKVHRLTVIQLHFIH